MKKRDGSKALLVELLIVILFFMLASTVLLRVFAKAHDLSVRAGIITRALNEAQSVADRLYASSAQEAELAALGFSPEGEAWLRTLDDYGIRVTAPERAETDGGVLLRREVQAFSGSDSLFSLPVAKYGEGERP